LKKLAVRDALRAQVALRTVRERGQRLFFVTLTVSNKNRALTDRLEFLRTALNADFYRKSRELRDLGVKPVVRRLEPTFRVSVARIHTHLHVHAVFSLPAGSDADVEHVEGAFKRRWVQVVKTGGEYAQAASQRVLEVVDSADDANVAKYLAGNTIDKVALELTHSHTKIDKTSGWSWSQLLSFIANDSEHPEAHWAWVDWYESATKGVKFQVIAKSVFSQLKSEHGLEGETGGQVLERLVREMLEEERREADKDSTHISIPHDIYRAIVRECPSERLRLVVAGLGQQARAAWWELADLIHEASSLRRDERERQAAEIGIMCNELAMKRARGGDEEDQA
jgi:hypothetical protein